MDEELGFPKYQQGKPKVGWLINMIQVSGPVVGGHVVGLSPRLTFGTRDVRARRRSFPTTAHHKAKRE